LIKVVEGLFVRRPAFIGQSLCTRAGISWTIPLGDISLFGKGTLGVYSLVLPSECINGFFLCPSIRSWDKNPLLWI